MASAETVTIPGNPAGVREGLDRVEACARGCGAPDSVRRRMLTALDEVLSNSLRHAAANGSGTIVITASPGPDWFVVDVADANLPFNPLLQPAPDTKSPLEERRPGGLGIMLVRTLSDDVRYERRGDRNHLTMAWRLVPGGEEQSNADR